MSRRVSLVAMAVLVSVAACAPAGPPASLAPAQPPPPLAERRIEFPPFHEAVLHNGLRLIVVEHRAQPVANVNLYVLSGAAADPAIRAGLAGMTADLLTKGTATRSATEIAETIERVGGNLGASAGADWITLSAGTLAEHLPLAFALVSESALRPNFPAEELELTRRRTLSGLQAALGQPGQIAQRTFDREVYGEEHPYGLNPVPGTVEGVTRDDVLAFHRTHFGAGNALLVVSGDVQAAEVEALARRHFGEWERGAASPVTFPAPVARERTRIVLVHRPGSAQSNILVGHLGLRPDTPDFFAVQVLNGVLGGGVDARLFQILREQRGWTYGAYSRFTRPREVGYFSANAEVRPEVTDSAVAEILTQLRRLREEPVSEEELEATKGFLAGSFPLRLETAGQIGSQIATTRLLGLPIEHLTEYRERIRAVTADDVQRVARQYILPDRAAIVVVGDATKIREALEPLAPVVMYDVEGRPLEAAALEVRAPTERLEGSQLQEGTRTYQFVVQGNPMGTYTSTLAREGEAWVATTRMESAMMNQEGEVRFRTADLSPIASRQTTVQGPMRVEMDLRHADGRVTGRAQLPPQMGGEREIDTEVVAGTLLPGMDEFVLAAADLREGRSITLPLYNVMGGNVVNVTYRVTGAEEVTVPAGSFPAYRVEVTGGPQPMTVWVRREAPHIMLRQEMAGVPVSIELESMQ